MNPLASPARISSLLSALRLRLLASAAAILCLGAPPSGALAEEDDNSVEGLYMKASEHTAAGEYAEASATFARLIELSGGMETLFEDYGAQAGGFFFDYAMTLMPQGRWEEAKEALDICLRAEEIAREVQTPIRSENARKELAKFQTGICIAQLGEHEEALALYDEYLASEPPEDELRQVYPSFRLRYGASLMKLGRIDEGVASIQELFDERDALGVTPQILMQGILELGLAWVEQAGGADGDAAAIDAVSERAHAFLDENADAIQLSPLDQFRFGFVERLRRLGLESARHGLYSVALRYFGFMPTVGDVRNDIHLALTRQPTGADIPAQFQALLDRLDAMEQGPVHPDADTLRLVAQCYERLGSMRAGRVINWHLAEQFPDAPEETRSEILHEASRLSSFLGDHSAAQYFGDQFMSLTPEDHALRNNVATFMLQSLFTSGDHEQVVSIAERVRERFDAGSIERELADSLYPLALYSLQRHEEAADPFSEYLKDFPEGSNREIVLFHRASNSLVRLRMREAAEHYEEFLREFPESERFLDNALADLTIARFNLEDYSASIEAAERLAAERPDSHLVGRSLNIAGDAYSVMASNLTLAEQKEQREEWEAASLQSYLAASAHARDAIGSDAERVDFHRSVAGEAIWKASDHYFSRNETEKGIEQYDLFFPDFEGTFFEPQISVFSLEHLEAAGRGEEGLQQVEKMILFLGGKPAEEQDLTLLRQAIGSYSQASVRIRGVEETLATLNDFPGMEPENQALLTWLMIQQVIVLQGEQASAGRDTPEYAAIESRIAAVFEDLREFELRNLSEFALREVGRYFAGTDNPFLAVPYFQELLARTNPEAEQFKGLAEMELALIEMRSPDPALVQSARARFDRVINQYNEPALRPEAHLNLAKLLIREREWREAREQLLIINRERRFFEGQGAKRAEAGFLLGTVFDELGDPVEANRAYLSVISTQGRQADWITQAWERYIPNSIDDFEKMPTSTPEEVAAKRARQLALYEITLRYLYMWQNFTDDDAPSGALRRLRRGIEDMRNDFRITPEEEQAIRRKINIPADFQPAVD